MEAQKHTGYCPGCKEPYKVGDYDDEPVDFSNETLSLLTPDDFRRDHHNMSMMKRNQNGEFHNNKWLFETQIWISKCILASRGLVWRRWRWRKL